MQRMGLEQHQKLLFVPLMQQSVKILQLPLLQLRQQIETELQENPLLEEEDDKEALKEIEELEKTREDELIDWNSYLEGMEDRDEEKRDSPDRDLNYENIISSHISLHEYLLQQLHTLSLPGSELSVGEAIIDAINDDGYLISSLESIAQFTGKGQDVAEKVLAYIQDLEPVGVGARDLCESLLIQIKYLGWDKNPLLVELIKHHLKDAQLKNYNKIASALGIKKDMVDELVRCLGNLEPKPGRLLSSTNPVYIEPDIIIRKVEGDFVVELNDDGVLRLKVSPYYKRLLRQDTSNETTTYIKERIKSAHWFIKCVDQRNKTLLQVAEAIFIRQRSFLDSGPSSILPLRMREIARLCGINESTVSRAASNKYVQTSWGIFPLKFFFTSSLDKDGKDVSSRRIKERIKSLIAEESARTPLTDDEIKDSLANEGLVIARRTVAKYREEMDILPSNLRKG